MTIHDLQQGDKVVVKCKKDSAKTEIVTYVQGVGETNIELIVDYLRVNGKIVSLTGVDAKLYYQTPEGKIAVFNIDDSRAVRGDIEGHILVINSEATFENRRNAVRIPFTERCVIQIDTNTPPIVCHFRDISATGVGLVMNIEDGKKCKKDLTVRGKFQYGKPLQSYVFNGVVKQSYVDEKTKYRNVGVELNLHNRRIMEDLVAKIQRDQLKRKRSVGVR